MTDDTANNIWILAKTLITVCDVYYFNFVKRHRKWQVEVQIDLSYHIYVITEIMAELYPSCGYIFTLPARWIFSLFVISQITPVLHINMAIVRLVKLTPLMEHVEVEKYFLWELIILGFADNMFWWFNLMQSSYSQDIHVWSICLFPSPRELKKSGTSYSIQPYIYRCRSKNYNIVKNISIIHQTVE